MELFATPGTKPTAAHIHPDQVESFTIHTGGVRVRLGREEHDHGAPETVVIPPGTPHTWTAVGDAMIGALAPLGRALGYGRSRAAGSASPVG